VADVAFEAVDGEVRPAEASGFVGFLDAVDGEFTRGITGIVFGPPLPDPLLQRRRGRIASGSLPKTIFESAFGVVLF
jgi:hypothetical protein